MDGAVLKDTSRQPGQWGYCKLLGHPLHMACPHTGDARVAAEAH